ncbi:hypothetical protein ACQEV4_37970 [Streptomyces shenzhenensis]|uniref:hypothetical protein n=1 Tax=Streptomyces shenzhenensis TaxID=943815 RepID=UPI003D9316D2
MKRLMVPLPTLGAASLAVTNPSASAFCEAWGAGVALGGGCAAEGDLVGTGDGLADGADTGVSRPLAPAGTPMGDPVTK